MKDKENERKREIFFLLRDTYYRMENPFISFPNDFH